MSNNQQSEFEKCTDSDFEAILDDLIRTIQDSGTRGHVLHLLSKDFLASLNSIFSSLGLPGFHFIKTFKKKEI
ncbi:conserved hypothetical protein [Ricinus communis]|uniref:Uncharacterized protein n=1 Tax=Ricinus communis TaxID=3988 RepID=B9STL1_RICCO|nr:conserved hypothetical protein [Ricinus communis]